MDFDLKFVIVCNTDDKNLKNLKYAALPFTSTYAQNHFSNIPDEILKIWKISMFSPSIHRAEHPQLRLYGTAKHLKMIEHELSIKTEQENR